MTEGTGGSELSRICREVQAQLPEAIAGTLPAWRRRLVDRHLRRCSDCRDELERQRRVAHGLEELGATVPVAEETEPPAELLDTLLERAREPDLRARAAVPARGAVSGARPVLSLVLLLAAALVGTAIGYASWRGARAVTGRGRATR